MWSRLFLLAVALAAVSSASAQHAMPLRVHHEIRVGGAVTGVDKATLGGWFRVGAPEYGRNGYAPIYATVGDSLLFEYAQNSDVWMFKNRKHYSQCDFDDATMIANTHLGAVSNAGAGVNRVQYFLTKKGKYYFGSSKQINPSTGRACADYNQRLVVFVDERKVSRGIDDEDVVHHEFVVGGNSVFWADLWGTFYTSYQWMWVQQHDKVVFHYSAAHDVALLPNKMAYEFCDFSNARLVATTTHGHGHNQRVNKYEYFASDVGTFYFASTQSHPWGTRQCDSANGGKMKIIVNVVEDGHRPKVKPQKDGAHGNSLNPFEAMGIDLETLVNSPLYWLIFGPFGQAELATN